jgi:Tat protein secretion system quality control protein TatD with DNase activity
MELDIPPRSHCLPLAGWVTSYTRAMLYNVLRQVPRDRLIAVETDGIYMTHDPPTWPA